MQGYEPNSVGVSFGNGYGWDRPCTFLDDDIFVIAVENKSAELAEDYPSLQFYRLSDKKPQQLWIEPFQERDCTIFSTNAKTGKFEGRLWYRKNERQLIALSETGAFVLNDEGEIKGSNTRVIYSDKEEWQYSPAQHQFYRWNPEIETVEIIKV